MRDRIIQLVALALLLGGIVGAYALSPTINQQRIDRQLTYDLQVGDSTNAAYTAASALGSFRGILINVMWQRSEALKQEGKFFEANNLAQSITTLQPRYPEAWNFQAWNMAYNISVKCKSKEERWDWVDKGLNLLRNRGIPNNPNAVVLYRSLAWILGHKMTGQTDDMHWYYKARMAERWQILLGIPATGRGLKYEFRGANRPPENEIDSEVHGQWRATLDFQRIADAADTYLRKPDRDKEDYNPANYFQTLSPDTIARFYQDNPGLRELIRELQAITGPSGEELELGLNTRTLRAFGRLQMYQSAGYNIQSPAVNNPETLGIDAMSLLNWLLNRDKNLYLNRNPHVDVQAARARVLEKNPKARYIDLIPMFNLLRALALVGEYHMDPAYMLATMQKFGPLDWRHPATHACYWTALGTLRSEQWTQNKDRIDFLNATRATIHALQHLAHMGKINFRPGVTALGRFGEEKINNSPDTRFIPAYGKALNDFIAKAKHGDYGKELKLDTFNNGHENFLQSAVYLYYFEGKEELAFDYLQKCKELYANNPNSPAANAGHYNLSLRDFAIARMQDDLGFQNIASIYFWIDFAWRRGLAERSTAVMARYLDAAKNRYDHFLKERQTEQRGDRGVQARQGLPPFEDILLQQYQGMMLSSEYSLGQKSIIWRNSAPLLASLSQDRPLLYECYKMLRPTVEQQLEVEGWQVDLDAEFPAPRGYAQWNQQFLQGPVIPGN